MELVNICALFIKYSYSQFDKFVYLIFIKKIFLKHFMVISYELKTILKILK